MLGETFLGVSLWMSWTSEWAVVLINAAFVAFLGHDVLGDLGDSKL